MVDCKSDDCNESFSSDKVMEVHFSKEHDDSAKEKSICKECGDLITYYPSEKKGLYCNICQKERPWDDGSVVLSEEDLPEEFHKKSYDISNVKQREFDLPPERRGDVSETKVLNEFQRREISILKPITDNEPYDLVIENKDKDLLKVQVKTGRFKKGCVKFNHRSTHTNSKGTVSTNYTKEEVDLFVIPTPELEEVFVISFTQLMDENIKSLRATLPKVNREDYDWAKDHTLGELPTAKAVGF